MVSQVVLMALLAATGLGVAGVVAYRLPGWAKERRRSRMAGPSAPRRNETVK
ncbi:MAG: hypothetical protein ACC655_00715 [Rhodothermia bacterium]